MKKVTFLMLGAGIISLITKFFKIAIIIFLVVGILVFVRGTIIKSIPQNNSMKWSDK